MIGRPVSMHAMRGIAAHTNGFHTCRAIHVLQILLGSIDVPGGHRYKPPYPKSAECHPRPAGRAATSVARHVHAGARRSATRCSPPTCWSRPTARRRASTRPIPGRRRWPPTA
jgi:anaerobic selenocysteine-containing dehydrogenase